MVRAGFSWAGSAWVVWGLADGPGRPGAGMRKTRGTGGAAEKKLGGVPVGSPHAAELAGIPGGMQTKFSGGGGHAASASFLAR